MADTIIIVNSSTGSDNNSGCGPGDGITAGTLLSGSDASTSDGGLTVTLPNADLTAVEVGHVIYLSGTAAGSLKHSVITAKANSGAADANVTVSVAFPDALSSQSYNIGGKKQTISSTATQTLWSNNAAAGDARGGWTIRMESGFTDTFAANLIFRRSGTEALGRINLEGAAGAAIKPAITFTNNGVGINYNGNRYINVSNIRLINSNATKTASYGFNNIGSFSTIKNCEVSAFFRGFGVNNNADNEFRVFFEDCLVENCADDAWNFFQAGYVVRNCVARGNRGYVIHAYFGIGTGGTSLVEENTFNLNGKDVIFLASGGGLTIGSFVSTIKNNTIHANSGHAVNIYGTGFTQYPQLLVENNNLTANSGYGINFSNATITDTLLRGFGTRIRNNNYGTGATANGSGFCNLTLVGVGVNNIGVDPSYTDPTGNFAVGTSVQGLAYPLTYAGLSTQRSFVDIGSHQVVQSSGSVGGTATYRASTQIRTGGII